MREVDIGSNGPGPCRECGQNWPGLWPRGRCRPCWDVFLDERRARVDAGPTALYRCYDQDGWLLYIGITLDPKRRFREHAKTFAWWLAVARHSVEWLPYGGFRARGTERIAIALERPACNQDEVTLPAECRPRMETGLWFDRAAQYREWRFWFAVWRDCQLQPDEEAARLRAKM